MSTSIIQAKQLIKSYPDGSTYRRVLDELELDILQGETVGIMGRSGSGKTTLLNLVGGLDRFDSGKLEVCGIDLHKASDATLLEYRKQNIGYVFQFHNLIPVLSAKDNVLFGIEASKGKLHDRDRAFTEELFEVMGLSDKMDELPSELSGGEQQRVAICRAIAKKPKLVLADEPTGNLDEKTGRTILNLIRHLSRSIQITFVVVTHDTKSTSFLNRVLHIGCGKIVQINSDNSC